ncbi:MAG: GAF domain-containing protein [Crocinitomicaceae bacterium]|nr:GAF domain-containing protein [Crocinitomicaceae bacterium]
MQLEFQELALIAEQMDQGVVVCANDGTIEFVNPYASKFFAFKLNELVGRKVNELSPDFKFNPEKMSESKAKLSNISVKNKFGEAVYFNATLVKAVSGERVIVMIEDVTKDVQGHNGLVEKINVVEKLTKSRYMREGLLTKAIQEILMESSKALQVERVNAWRADKDFTMIECIGNYTRSTNTFNDKVILLRKDMPAYFKLLATQEIIATNYSLEDSRTEELVESYLEKYGITSMIDVPIRIEGEMIGVVCFEHVGIPRKWDLTERKFGMFIAQLISLALESFEKQQNKQKLQKVLAEKEALLREMGKS